MSFSKLVLIIVVIQAAVCAGCGNDDDGKKNNLGTIANKMGRRSMVEEYPKVPTDELVRDVVGNKLYPDLQIRYSQQLMALQHETDKDQAKLIVVIMTPEVGKFATNANIYGVPYILQICENQGIDCIDVTPDIAEWTSADDAKRAPTSGNWTREGAAFTADMLAGAVAKYEDYRSPKKYDASERPSTFGDALKLNEEDGDLHNESTGGEKKLRYRLKINSQGLRMGHDLAFPKTKQRILFLGDSRIFNPFLDDEFIITEILQRKFPEKEIVNAGNLSYTMDDYLSLYHDKARYMEPDVVIVCTNGGDILDEYFSHRNRYSRVERCYRPSDIEKQFYRQITKGGK